MCVCVYTHTMKYYSAIEKEWNPAICNNMGGPGGYYAKWSKSDKERDTVWFHLYVQSKNQNK